MANIRWIGRWLLACLLCANTLHAQQRPFDAETLPPTGSTPDSASTLTLPALEELALQHNPTLTQASAQIAISRGKAIQAGLYPNPMVGYTAEQIGAAGTAGELQGGFFEQEIVTAGKLQLSRAKYAQEALQAQAQFEAQQYRVQSSVRRAFYETLATQRQIEIRRQLYDNANDALTTTRALVNVGQANRPDLLQSELQAHRMRTAVRSAEKRWEGHWQELTAVVGMPELTFAPLDGTLEIGEGEMLDADQSLEQLLDCSPQLRAAWAEVRRDQIAVRRELAEPIPNINLRVETGYNFESENTVAGVSAGVKLPLFDRNQGGVLQARAELTRAQAEVARIELILRRKFGERFAEYEANLVTARSYEMELLPRAREAYELYLEGFQNRRAAWPQVLVAQREYFQLSDEYLETLLELRRAEADINGLFLGDGLDQPPTPMPQGHRDATPRPR